MNKVAFINGHFIPVEQAKISAFDRGFLFADSVYEVIPVYQSQVKFLEEHIRRLEKNLSLTGIKKPVYDWAEALKTLVALNHHGDMQIYLQVSRGVDYERSHDIPIGITPTVVAFTLHKPFPDALKKSKGISAFLVEDIRWQSCDIKSNALIANLLLNQKALIENADTAILIREGVITEGSSSNIFVIDKNNRIRTPRQDNHCLPGITRSICLQLLNQLNVPVFEEDIPEQDLFEAKEIWLTSTSKEIMPVSQLNGKPVGTGNPGQLWTDLNQLYQQLVRTHDR